MAAKDGHQDEEWEGEYISLAVIDFPRPEPANN